MTTNPYIPQDPATYRNTSVMVYDDATVYTLHNTAIATILHNPDEADRSAEITLNSGGYRTPTTKRRMNEILRYHCFPFYVYQNKSVWYVGVVGMNAKSKIPFYDKINLIQRIHIGEKVAS